jgi:hypothetical protein
LILITVALIFSKFKNILNGYKNSYRKDLKMSMSKRAIVSCVLLLVTVSCVAVEKDLTQVDPTAMKNWQDMRFGMFIHWGLYAIPGGIWKGKKMEELRGPSVAEWIQFGAEIPRAEYAKLASEFNPVDFDADAIAKLAFDAGMKYVVITSKHHDGFAMYDSEVSEYDIMDASPYKKDVDNENINFNNFKSDHCFIPCFCRS